MTAQAWVAVGFGLAGLLIQIVVGYGMYKQFTGSVSARMEATDKRLDEFKTENRKEQDNQWSEINDAREGLAYLRGKSGNGAMGARP